MKGGVGFLEFPKLRKRKAGEKAESYPGVGGGAGTQDSAV